MRTCIAAAVLLALPWTRMAANSQEPTEAGVQEAQLCKSSDIDTVATFLNLPALELKSQDGQPQHSIPRAAACKANPAAPNQTVVAVAYDAGKEDSKALSIVMLDNVHQRL